MPRRRASTNTEQLGFLFEAPTRARGPADLAGLDRQMSSAVALILKDEFRSREEIAGAMSALLDEEVSRAMLDAYASPAREGHNISAARFYALIAVTERFDVMDRLTRRIGAAVLIGEEIHSARIGHLRSQKARIETELRNLERTTPPISRRGQEA